MPINLGRIMTLLPNNQSNQGIRASQKVYRGSCLCSQVRFSVSGFSENVANCHCTMCRKFHGAAFGTLVSVENLQWLSGLEQLKDYTADNGTVRTFCSNCGSSIGFRVMGAPFENIELAIATFDEDLPVIVGAQIYTEYKANWVSLMNNVKCYLRGRA